MSSMELLLLLVREVFVVSVFNGFRCNVFVLIGLPSAQGAKLLDVDLLSSMDTATATSSIQATVKAALGEPTTTSTILETVASNLLFPLCDAVARRERALEEAVLVDQGVRCSAWFYEHR